MTLFEPPKEVIQFLLECDLEERVKLAIGWLCIPTQARQKVEGG
jgi:hypothetical protein